MSLESPRFENDFYLSKLQIPTTHAVIEILSTQDAHVRIADELRVTRDFGIQRALRPLDLPAQVLLELIQCRCKANEVLKAIHIHFPGLASELYYVLLNDKNVQGIQALKQNNKDGEKDFYLSPADLSSPVAEPRQTDMYLSPADISYSGHNSFYYPK